MLLDFTCRKIKSLLWSAVATTKKCISSTPGLFPQNGKNWSNSRLFQPNIHKKRFRLLPDPFPPVSSFRRVEPWSLSIFLEKKDLLCAYSLDNPPFVEWILVCARRWTPYRSAAFCVSWLASVAMQREWLQLLLFVLSIVAICVSERRVGLAFCAEYCPLKWHGYLFEWRPNG